MWLFSAAHIGTGTILMLFDSLIELLDLKIMHWMLFDVVILLYCRRATQSVGLLSYTFLRKTGQDDVIVPMVDV